MKISALIAGMPVIRVEGDVQQEITGIHFDSRQVTEGSLFVAVKGRTVDGHAFIDKAVDRGAVGVVVQDPQAITRQEVCQVVVPDSARALARMAGAFYGHPSAKLKLVGVTGTNGKTTVATLLYRMFTGLGYRCGLLSTVENRIAEDIEAAMYTTPDAITLQASLARMVEAGCTHAFMEVSSHALDQGRVEGMHWDGAVFTNLTHDHLDYHGSFNAYIQAKKIFFDGLSAQAFALLNADDAHAEVMVQNSLAKVSKYSLTRMADFRARILENRIDGLHLELDGIPVHVRLVGRFNAYNILAVYGAAVLLGESREAVMTALSRLTPAEGRFDVVTGRKAVFAVVDYAHTPDALQNVLSTLLQVRSAGQRVLCVIGCGGDRDTAKRPAMAAIACRLADEVVLTADNPRTENPEHILDQMWSGIPAAQADRVLRITDRREAIRTAVRMAQPGDIILVAGKGHEKYQEINGHRYPFDDKKVLAEALA